MSRLMRLTKVILSQTITLTRTLTTPGGGITQISHGGKMTKMPKVTKITKEIRILIDQIKVMVTKGIALMHHQSLISN